WRCAGRHNHYAVQSRRRVLVPCDGARSVCAELRGGPMNRKFPAVICMVAAALGALSSCSRGNVDAKTNDAPATTVERAADLNLVSVENPERFPLVTVASRSEEHTSELQSRFDLVCRLLLEKKN